jgi:hypothetical protein
MPIITGINTSTISAVPLIRVTRIHVDLGRTYAHNKPRGAYAVTLFF